MQELIDSLLEESKINKELDKKKDKLKAAVTNEKYRLVEEIMKVAHLKNDFADKEKQEKESQCHGMDENPALRKFIISSAHNT